MPQQSESGGDSGHTALTSGYSFIPPHDKENRVLISATEFTYEYFQHIVQNDPERAYRELHKLKLAYDESQTRHADLKMRLADLVMDGRIPDVERPSGTTQTGGTYGGSIATSSGHVRQGNELAGKPYTY
jgi:hypothetical protein